jgi:DNA-binding NtrC family response regulator
MMVAQSPTVVVVTDKEVLKSSLLKEAAGANLKLHLSDCEYRCSMMVEAVRPDFVVIDCSLGAERSRDFVSLLREDPRIPYVRIILAGDRHERPKECDQMVFAFIERPFTASMLSDLIGGSRL